MSKRTLEEFKKYKLEENRSVYGGKQNESGQYCEALWRVDGTGRAIIAQIIVGGKIAHEKIFSYDCFIEYFRQKKHKEMMIEAILWAWLYEGIELGRP